jgi:hypothetical protein
MRYRSLTLRYAMLARPAPVWPLRDVWGSDCFCTVILRRRNERVPEAEAGHGGRAGAAVGQPGADERRS